MSFMDILLIRGKPIDDIIPKINTIVKAATTQTELFRLLKRKDKKKELALLGITIKDVNAEIDNAIEKYRSLDKGGHKENLPMIAYSQTDLNETRRNLPKVSQRQRRFVAAAKPRIGEPSYIIDALIQIKPHTTEGFVDKLISVIHQKKPIQMPTRKMSLQEESLNNVLVALERDNKITDNERNALQQYKVTGDKYLVKLNNSMYKKSKAVHPNIVNKLIFDEQGKLKKSKLYYKFERYLQAEFNKTMPNTLGLERLMRKLMDRKRGPISIGIIMASLLEDKYPYKSSKSKGDLSRLVGKLNTLIDHDWDEVTDYFMDDDNDWTLQAADASVDYEWEQLSQQKKEDSNYLDFRGKQLIKFVEAVEENYKLISDYSTAIRTLIQKINEKEEENNSTTLPKVNKVREQYQEISEQVTDYENYKRQALENLEAQGQRNKEAREKRIAELKEINAPKSEAEKEWESQRYAQEREALAESEENRKTERVTTTERVTDFNIETLREKHRDKVKQEIESAKEKLKTANDNEKKKIQEIIDRAEEKLKELSRI